MDCLNDIEGNKFANEWCKIREKVISDSFDMFDKLYRRVIELEKENAELTHKNKILNQRVEELEGWINGQGRWTDK